MNDIKHKRLSRLLNEPMEQRGELSPVPETWISFARSVEDSFGRKWLEIKTETRRALVRAFLNSKK